MSSSSPPTDEGFHLDLRSPPLAALLAWLWPGAGHLYQRRYGKGVLFMVCILSTWFFGLALGEGHTVYASSRTIANRLVYGCQLGVGLPATPALLQSMQGAQNEQPRWGGFMAPPNEAIDELSLWHYTYGSAYDMGVLYTMIAGLLNILAIFDAYAGPVWASTDDEKKRKPANDDKGGGTPKPATAI